MNRPVVAMIFGVFLILSGVAVGGPVPFDGNFDSGPCGWKPEAPAKRGDVSEWDKTGGRNGSGCIHLKNAGHAAGNGEDFGQMWTIQAKDLPAGKRLKVRFWIKAKGVSGRATLYANTAGESWLSERSPPLDGTFDWEQIGFVMNVPLKYSWAGFVFVLEGDGEVWLDDLTLEEAGEAATVAPGLFDVWTDYAFIGAGKGATLELLMPVPLRYREQVPVACELTTIPAGKLKAGRIYRDTLENHVARIELAHLKKGEWLEIVFHTVVLVGPRSFDKVPLDAEIPAEWPEQARPWLRATRSAEIDHPKIRETAARIRGNRKKVGEVLEATLREADRIYRIQKGRCAELGALEALEKQGSCTSAANLVAALIRANGIPARILAGYPAWSGPLQTHYIVEAYVPGYGWYPIEPSLLKRPWHPWQQIEVAIVPPEHEDQSQPRRGGAGGVPYLSLTEWVKFDPKGLMPGEKTVILDDGCDHLAKPLRNFQAESPAEWNKVLQKAGRHWERWLQTEPQPGPDGAIRSPIKIQDLKTESIKALESSL